MELKHTFYAPICNVQKISALAVHCVTDYSWSSCWDPLACVSFAVSISHALLVCPESWELDSITLLRKTLIKFITHIFVLHSFCFPLYTLNFKLYISWVTICDSPKWDENALCFCFSECSFKALNLMQFTCISLWQSLHVSVKSGFWTHHNFTGWLFESV